MESLFVYGTLCPGRSNEHVLSSIGGIYKPASVKGRLYPHGWLDDFPYLGIDLDEEGDDIAGYIFTSPDLYRHWRRLDAFEGGNYRRVRTMATRNDGRRVEVFVYVINRSSPWAADAS